MGKNIFQEMTVSLTYTSHSDESDSDADEIEVVIDPGLDNLSGLTILSGTQISHAVLAENHLKCPKNSSSRCPTM